MFYFQLPSIKLERRLEKLENEHCNVETIISLLLVKILGLSMVCVHACFWFYLYGE